MIQALSTAREALASHVSADVTMRMRTRPTSLFWFLRYRYRWTIIDTMVPVVA